MFLSSVHARVIRFVIIACLFGFLLSVFQPAFAFPYKQQRRVVAWVHPNYPGFEREFSSGNSFPDRYATGWYPVSIRYRQSILFGTTEYNVWVIPENGEKSDWFKAHGIIVNNWKVYYGGEGGDPADQLLLLHALESGKLQTRTLKFQYPKEILTEVRSGEFGLLNATLRSQGWRGMTANEPKEYVLTSDVAALRITVELRNRSEQAVSVTNDFFLSSDGKYLIAYFYPYDGDYEDNKPVTLDLEAKEFICAPQETRVIKMMSLMLPFNELRSYKKLEVVHIHQGWAWPATPLPEREELFSTKQGGSRSGHSFVVSERNEAHIDPREWTIRNENDDESSWKPTVVRFDNGEHFIVPRIVRKGGQGPGYLQAVASIAHSDTLLYDILIDLLKDPLPQHRAAGAYAIALSPAAPLFAREMCVALTDSSDAVVACATIALMEAGPTSRSCVDILCDIVSSERSNEVRLGAIKALQRIRFASSRVRSVLTEATNLSNPDFIREEATRVLSLLKN